MFHKHRALVGVCGLLLTLTVNCLAADPDRVAVLGSTVPANGDINPYGVARIPSTVGKLVAGRFLVSNFNNSANQQGTGTTIVQMSANGSMQLFAQIDPKRFYCPGGIGLTTALVALKSGFVVVGSLPTKDGTSATAKEGCLLVLNSNGEVVETISEHHINGPWDMTAVDSGDSFALFVTNVLNGTVDAGGNIVYRGTVVRLLFTVSPGETPRLLDSQIIASGFPERTDPGALVIGPTGVAFDPATGNLLVADSLDNQITAIPDALTRSKMDGTGITVSAGGALNDPLGISLVGSDLYVANGDDGKMIEIDIRNGAQIDADLVDNSGGPPPGTGALFGLWALDNSVYFVDDATNTFNLLH